MISCRKHVLPLVLLSCFATATYGQSDPSFANVAISLSEDHEGALGERISLTLSSNSAQKIAQTLTQWSGIEVQHVAKDALTLTMVLRPEYQGEVIKQYTSASFVIDLDEDSTTQFTAAFATQYTGPLSVEEAEKYVSEYIDDTTYIHGFNFASTVAREKSGDCTEFAVLTTALMRALGKPGRVVFGTVIIEDEVGVTAYGHAWTEVWHDNKWQVMDAALYGLDANKRFYLPGSVIDNEGPGYGMSLATGTILMPVKFYDVKSAS